jgi:hypothetical protein
VDNTPPVVLNCPPDDTLELSPDTCEADVSYTATAYDQCSGEQFSETKTFEFNAPGELSYTYTFTDNSNNTSSCVQTLKAVDNTPPVFIGSSLDMGPPNGKYFQGGLYSCGELWDACDGDLSTEDYTQITRATSDEPENGGGDGNTVEDILPLNDTSGCFRSERQGGGDGRVYTLYGVATDTSGNRIEEVSCQLYVPRGNEAEDSVGDGYEVSWKGTPDLESCPDKIPPGSQKADTQAQQPMSPGDADPVSGFGYPEIPQGADETPLPYDFNGDGKTDDSDIAIVSALWNKCEGDPEYNPFYDLDDDGCISVLDIMPVVNSKNIP